MSCQCRRWATLYKDWEEVYGPREAPHLWALWFSSDPPECMHNPRCPRAPGALLVLSALDDGPDFEDQ